MKVFISWSGNRSRVVADYLSVWIKCVLQASQPWISTRHIDRGAIWFSEINEQLQDVSVGIICLTKENKNKPWILFECGALAKGLTTNRVCTLLVDLETHEITDPLAQFNHTYPNKSGMWELVKTLNIALGERGLEESVLVTVFDTYWPQFESRFTQILLDNPPEDEAPPLTEREILSEILSMTRSNSNRLAVVEGRVSSSKPVEPKRTNSSTNLDKAVDLAVEMVIQGKTDPEVLEALVNIDYPISNSKKLLETIRKSRSAAESIT
ncbi:hypothetical protein D3C77_242760 [compost metagenome]|uniref:toll/interleukin-1 receptor domain-containing protein n=1 Tax=Pseudomonas sp. JUb96 TaxID=2940539 RepID=UPI000F95FA6A|nr:toll/interleukin-1 receptor domain-containing protein [Pseudomonas sp. JUb96]MCW2270877.1 hypothetical protein [Pseudomonas sp. JUb96]